MSRYELHGPIAVGDRIYFGYGTFLNGVVQIIDRERLIHGDPALEDPFEPTDENLEYPAITTLFTGPRLGAHTTFPVLGMDVPEFADNSEGRSRDMLLVVGESLRNECLENRQMMYMVDITDETKPWPVANFQVPEESGNFCERGGRFGTHSSNENHDADLLRQDRFPGVFQRRNPGGGHPRPLVAARSRLLHPRHQRARRRSAASPWTGQSVASARSRRTTSTWTTAATCMPPTGPTRACTSSR